MDELNNAITMLQAYQATLFAILAFVQFYRYDHYSKKFLGWFLVLTALYSLSKAVGFQGVYQVFSYICPLGITLLLSLFPLFYFYLKSLIIPGYRFRRRELIHLLPALLLLLVSVPLYLLPDAYRSSFNAPSPGIDLQSWPGRIHSVYNLCVYGYFSLQIVIYSSRVASLFKRHNDNIERAFSDTSTISLSWVFTLLILFLLFLILLGISRIAGLNQANLFHNLIHVAELLIILVFSVFAIVQQDIYPHRVAGAGIAEESPPAAVETAEPEPVPAGGFPEPVVVDVNTLIEPCDSEDCCRVKKYAGSGLSEQQKKVLKRKLDKLMNEKLYLEVKLTIDDVAAKLETNSKYLSQMINESHRKNFYTFINTFRIAEAQRLLNDRQHEKYSIQGIARLSGFSSKSSFNEAFRRITGMTPSEYVERGGEMA